MIYILEWAIDLDIKGVVAIFTTLEEAQRSLDLHLKLVQDDFFGMSYWITPTKIFTTMEEHLASENEEE